MSWTSHTTKNLFIIQMIKNMSIMFNENLQIDIKQKWLNKKGNIHKYAIHKKKTNLSSQQTNGKIFRFTINQGYENSK